MFFNEFNKIMLFVEKKIVFIKKKVKECVFCMWNIKILIWFESF